MKPREFRVAISPPPSALRHPLGLLGQAPHVAATASLARHRTAAWRRKPPLTMLLHMGAPSPWFATRGRGREEGRAVPRALHTPLRISAHVPCARVWSTWLARPNEATFLVVCYAHLALFHTTAAGLSDAHRRELRGDMRQPPGAARIHEKHAMSIWSSFKRIATNAGLDSPARRPVAAAGQGDYFAKSSHFAWRQRPLLGQHHAAGLPSRRPTAILRTAAAELRGGRVARRKPPQAVGMIDVRSRVAEPRG